MESTKIKLNCLDVFLFLVFFRLISDNIITLKFKGTGEESSFMNQMEGRHCPDKITIDGEIMKYPLCKYKFDKKIVTIKMYWCKNITNFYRMFSNISNIIEVDLSQFNTSLIINMAYMFENCESLVFANMSNINLNSVMNMEYMFSNCISLKLFQI